MSSALSDSITDTTTAAATACAKVNLTLDVLDRRDDGYHELRSLVIGVDLRDDIRSSRRSETGLVLKCTDRRLAGSDNLVCRAVRELAAYSGHQPSLLIELRKRIPVGAGLGGGSSDAATTLRMCNQLWGLGLDDAALAAIGARLGSDVPLFFSLPAAVMTGRGEQVEPVTLRWSGWVLLVSAGVVVPTAEVYAGWRPEDSASALTGMDEAIREATSAEELSTMVGNHLQQAVFRVSPHVAEIHHRLDQSGFGPMTISGAGSTMYRLFDNKDEACHVAREIEAKGPDVVTTVVAAPVGQDPIEMREEN
ncbi:MAG: 4-(cytidine 5'-diphospho)-2-C-methyl-D-erythritol kinase [Planctomycetota bacterium]|jgi:4-diphosphocytidyl-2-C-methyl-D-erythritol kinase